LVEAQSQRLPCIATNIAGIPELIEQGVTGLIVPPETPAELAQAMSKLIRDPARRAALGAAGERRVRDCFSMTSGIDLLCRRFGLVSNYRLPCDPQGTASGALREIHPLEEDAAFQVLDSPSAEVLVHKSSS